MPYVKNVEDNPRPATRGSFMADARASGDAPAKKPRASSTLREVRKLSWFEKNVLCMKVDIHRQQYHAHCERLDIAHTQDVILHHVRGGKGSGPKPKPKPEYKKWNTSRYNWVEMEQALYASSTQSFPQSAAAADDDDEQYDDDQGDDEEESAESEESEDDEE